MIGLVNYKVVASNLNERKTKEKKKNYVSHDELKIVSIQVFYGWEVRGYFWHFPVQKLLPLSHDMLLND